MNIKIIYESKTGNTKIIAESIQEACKEYGNVTFKNVEEVIKDNVNDQAVDLYFLGSWTDKGDCGAVMKEFCAELNNQNVAIFGTAGFGGSEEY